MIKMMLQTRLGLTLNYAIHAPKKGGLEERESKFADNNLPLDAKLINE